MSDSLSYRYVADNDQAIVREILYEIAAHLKYPSVDCMMIHVDRWMAYVVGSIPFAFDAAIDVANGTYLWCNVESLYKHKLKKYVIYFDQYD